MFWARREEFTWALCGELPGAWHPLLGSMGPSLLPNPLVKHCGIKWEGGEHIPLLSLPSMNSSIDCHWVISMGRWYPVWMQVTTASQKKGNGELAPLRRRGKKSPDPAWTYFVFWKGWALSPRFTGWSDRQEINHEKPSQCSTNGGWEDTGEHQMSLSHHKKHPQQTNMQKKKSKPRTKERGFRSPFSYV